MSVDSGSGSTEGWRLPGAPGGAGQPVLASPHETYAAYLFDYCAELLRDPGAAADAVQQTLTVGGAETGQLLGSRPDPGPALFARAPASAWTCCRAGPAPPWPASSPGRAGSDRGAGLHRGNRGLRMRARDTADRAGCARRVARWRSRGAQSCLPARIRCLGPRRSARSLAPASPAVAVPGEPEVREVRGRRCGAVRWWATAGQPARPWRVLSGGGIQLRRR